MKNSFSNKKDPYNNLKKINQTISQFKHARPFKPSGKKPTSRPK